MMRLLLIGSLSLLPSISSAFNRAIMEGIPSTRSAIFVDTKNARVDIATNTYLGGTTNVGLSVSSNVVISDGSSAGCIVYSTGSINCTGTVIGSGGATINNVTLGDAGQVNKPQMYVYALSVDGANEATGCLGILGESASNALVWTSTTTASAVGRQGVTSGACNAGAICLIAISGQILVTETGATTKGDQVLTSTTRCQGTQTAGVGTNSMGYILKAIGSAGPVDVFY